MRLDLTNPISMTLASTTLMNCKYLVMSFVLATPKNLSKPRGTWPAFQYLHVNLSSPNRVQQIAAQQHIILCILMPPAEKDIPGECWIADGEWRCRPGGQRHSTVDPPQRIGMSQPPARWEKFPIKSRLINWLPTRRSVLDGFSYRKHRKQSRDRRENIKISGFDTSSYISHIYFFKKRNPIQHDAFNNKEILWQWPYF